MFINDPKVVEIFKSQGLHDKVKAKSPDLNDELDIKHRSSGSPMKNEPVVTKESSGKQSLIQMASGRFKEFFDLKAPDRKLSIQLGLVNNIIDIL